jgi:hypothetical protein
MKNQDKALLIGGVILAAGVSWYFTRPKTNYAPLPGQRGYGEGIGDGIVPNTKGSMILPSGALLTNGVTTKSGSQYSSEIIPSGSVFLAELTGYGAKTYVPKRNEFEDGMLQVKNGEFEIIGSVGGGIPRVSIKLIKDVNRSFPNQQIIFY